MSTEYVRALNAAESAATSFALGEQGSSQAKTDKAIAYAEYVRAVEASRWDDDYWPNRQAAWDKYRALL